MSITDLKHENVFAAWIYSKYINDLKENMIKRYTGFFYNE